MGAILRGEIWWAILDPTLEQEQQGTRPVLVLSHDIFNARSGTVIAVAISSSQPKVGFPLAFELTSVNLPNRSWVKLGQIRTLSTSRFRERLGAVSSEELARAIEGLNELIT